MATRRSGSSVTDRTPAGAMLLAALCVLLIGLGCPPTGASDEQSHHVVVLADPHLPGKPLASKTAVIERIGGWADVDRVVVLGDICEDRGTAEEYAFAKQFFSALARISDGQLDWLRGELARHSGTPTAIFFHAPLRGTLAEYNERVNKDDFVAQPHAGLRALLLQVAPVPRSGGREDVRSQAGRLG